MKFAREKSQKIEDNVKKKPWIILIADDEAEVHETTVRILNDSTYDGCPFQFIHAYSGLETKELLSQSKDIAVILLDVVMEKDDSGLELVKFIRDDLNNSFIRIVLRTGQPGQAPEEEVVINYDINECCLI